MRDDSFDTAEMLKRLQRQVSGLQGGTSQDSVTIFQETTDTAQASDSTSYPEYAIKLSGIGSTDQVTSGVDLGDPQKFTVATMFRLTALDVDANDNYRQLVHAGEDFITVEETGTLGFRVPGVDTTLFTAGSVSTGDVYTAVFVYDQSDRIVYVDGDLANSQTIGSGTVNFGSISLAGGNSSHTPAGVVDGLRIDSRVWSETEVTDWHAEAGVDDSDCELCWLMEDDSLDTTVTDTSGNDYTGTFQDSPEWVGPLSWERDLAFTWGVSQWSESTW